MKVEKKKEKSSHRNKREEKGERETVKWRTVL